MHVCDVSVMCECVMSVICDISGSSVPEGMAIQSVHGFVEELVVNDDPEYQVYKTGISIIYTCIYMYMYIRIILYIVQCKCK